MAPYANCQHIEIAERTQSRNRALDLYSFEAAQRSAHKRYGKAFRKLAE